MDNLVTEKVVSTFTGSGGNWTFNGSAQYNNNRARLTPEQSDSEGNIKWRGQLSEKVWRAEYRVDIENNYTGSAEEIVVLFYHDNAGSSWQPQNGYYLSFDHNDNEVRLVRRDDGVDRETYTQSLDISGDAANEQHNIRVSFDYGSVTAYFNSKKVFEQELDTVDYSGDGFGFGARTTTDASAQFVDDIRLISLTDRNIKRAEDEWDNSGIAFGKSTNTHQLVESLASMLDRSDKTLYDVKRSKHIDTASGSDLDRFGELVQLDRKSEESDDKYRARLKLQFRVGNIGTTFDAFSKFAAVLLETNIDNITFNSNFELNPATFDVGAELEVFNKASISRLETAEFLSEAVPAGHNVRAFEIGSFRLKSSGDSDDQDKGLTGDGTSTGGTLTREIVGHNVRAFEIGSFRLKSIGDRDDRDEGLEGDGTSTRGTLARGSQ